ncbi:MAG: hypothetical protein L6Q71_08450, partial [Planctomycetes bacterium]|nr:hypothetical protein [Planctomycetota bacterium]
RVQGTFDESLNLSNLNLDHCELVIQPHNELNFDHCVFLNCRITVVQGNEHSQHIVFDHCVLNQCRITYAAAGVTDAVFDYDDPRDGREYFDTPERRLRNTLIDFQTSSRLTACYIDTVVSTLRLSESSFKDCRFRGYVGNFVANGVLDNPDIRTIGDGWTSERLAITGGVWYPYLDQRMSAGQLQFDETFIDASQIARHCESKEGIDIQRAEVDDAWETLRDEFTGVRFFLHLVLVVGFILPIIFKGMFIAAYSQTMETAHITGHWVNQGEIVHMPMIEVLAFGGYSGVAKWIHLCTFAGLVLYNALRYFVTMWVGALREREEHRATLGFKLCRPPDAQVKWPWRLRTALNWLLLIALGATLWHAIEFLFIDVPYMVR